MSIAVAKFGGTSVDLPDELMQDVASIQRTHRPVLVVSAYSGQTDELLAISKCVLGNLSRWQSTKIRIEDRKDELFALFLPIINFTTHQHSKASGVDGVPPYITFYLHSQIWSVVDSLFPLLQKAGVDAREEQQIATYVEDRIVGIGELFSSRVTADILTNRSAVGQVFKQVALDDVLDLPYDAYPVNTESQDIFYADIADEIAQRVLAVLEQGEIPVVSGYMGFAPGGILNVIDRGYSDFTAASTILGLSQAGISEEELILQIWKRVPGLLTTDPRLCEPNYSVDKHVKADDFKVTNVVRQVSRREVAELAGLGGMKAVNPRMMEVIRKIACAVEMRNTCDPEDPGTVITMEEDMKNRGIRMIAGAPSGVIFRVHNDNFPNTTGALAKIGEICRDLDLLVDAVTTSETSVSLSLSGDEKRLTAFSESLSAIGAVDRFNDLAMVCCVGNDLKDREGVLALITTVLAANGISIQFDGGDPDSNITVLIPKGDRERAIKALHQAIIEKGYQSIADVPGFEAVREALALA